MKGKVIGKVLRGTCKKNNKDSFCIVEHESKAQYAQAQTESPEYKIAQGYEIFDENVSDKGIKELQTKIKQGSNKNNLIGLLVGNKKGYMQTTRLALIKKNPVKKCPSTSIMKSRKPALRCLCQELKNQSLVSFENQDFFPSENEESFHSENEKFFHSENEESFHSGKEEFFHSENEEPFHSGNEEFFHSKNEESFHSGNEEPFHSGNEELFHSKNEESFHSGNEESFHSGNKEFFCFEDERFSHFEMKNPFILKI